MSMRANSSTSISFPRDPRRTPAHRAATVSELKDGRIVRATNYNSHAEALEAAGLSE